MVSVKATIAVCIVALFVGMAEVKSDSYSNSPCEVILYKEFCDFKKTIQTKKRSDCIKFVKIHIITIFLL
ncbi:hypothetical protein EB796_006144 [Bugula neritina]|uniref:Uncharacterized protein n=1 Tax=Bugula neritina TaxID=10212 RepID=A0A7J7KDC4_BUGNE|nr:hypothetical protein EB796_006144 [Bugula neritina]